MADDLQRPMEGVEDSVALTATTPAPTTLIPPPRSVSWQFFRSSRPATELRRFEFKQAAGAADASGGVVGSGAAGAAASSIAIQSYGHVRQLICMSHSVKH